MDLVSSTLAGDASCVVCASCVTATSRHAFISPKHGKQKQFVHFFTDTYWKHA